MKKKFQQQVPLSFPADFLNKAKSHQINTHTQATKEASESVLKSPQ